MYTYDNNGNKKQIVENFQMARSDSPKPEDDKKSKMHKILMIVLGVILAVAIIGLVMMMLKKHSNSESAQAPAESIMSAFGMSGKRGSRYGFNFY
jgi:multidrug resistance efflux pump